MKMRMERKVRNLIGKMRMKMRRKRTRKKFNRERTSTKNDREDVDEVDNGKDK